MSSVSVRVEEDLKKEMSTLEVNWSEYIREAIRAKIATEKRRKAGERLLTSLDKREHRVPDGFINDTIRKTRETR